MLLILCFLSYLWATFLYDEKTTAHFILLYQSVPECPEFYEYLRAGVIIIH